MVRPTSFGYDLETAKTNTFQRRLAADAAMITAQAEAEFDNFVTALRKHDIGVTVFDDPDPLPKPNAVFPNNWLVSWPDGRLFLYPMATESRRRERSQAALAQLAAGFQVTEIVDLSATERDQVYLEGTGVLVFDHRRRVGYAAVSPRCDEQLAREHIQALGYEPVIFHASDNHGTAIYHTNVMMGVQDTTAVVCLEVIQSPGERERVRISLESTGHSVVDISLTQVTQFCGNVIELVNAAGQRFLLMSQSAYDGFSADQRAALGKDKTLLPVAIPTIETVGGGSARCMVAELFLTPQPSPATIAYL